MAQLSGISRSFVRAAMDAPYLSREDEHALAVRWRDNGDQDALEQLTRAHMRLVIAIAARFRNYGLPVPDLVQEGHVGLLEAAARFEPEREVRFSTYATWWIRASIQDFVLRNWSIVRGGTSSAQKALFFNLRRLRMRIAQRMEQEPGLDLHAEIAAAVGVQKADVVTMEARLSGPDMSLNAPVSDEDSGSADRGDFFADTGPLPDELVGEAIDGERRYEWLQSALTVLSERELRILRERKLSEEGETLEALGSKLGISKERVRQIENRALEKLRKALIERNPQLVSAYG
ncbi:MAG: RNA polymerase factor sigma-32 [Beijerinckiaceae bacterium]|nr:RNA polymerase factor sigma-32 [Beijerinckiaceae bacterium]